MIEQVLQATEKWLLNECRTKLDVFTPEGNVWETAAQLSVQPEQLKRWFTFLSRQEALTGNVTLEYYTLPALHNPEGDGMLAFYRDDHFWIGYPFERFASQTNAWNLEGVLQLLYHLFPEEVVAEGERYQNEQQAVDAAADPQMPDDDWGFAEQLNVGDLPSEQFDQAEDGELNAVDEEESDLPEQEVATAADEVDEHFLAVIATVKTKLENSMRMVNESVDETMRMVNSGGSKKLLRLLLNVEEEMNEIHQVLVPQTTDEEQR